MFSELFVKLWENGIILKGIWETIYMTALSSLIAYIIGLPLGVILNVTDKGGIRPIRWLNCMLGLAVNFFRSIPFIILMVAMLPVAKWILGVSLGNGAMIVMLVIAASPYVARMVESALKEVDGPVHGRGQSADSLESASSGSQALPCHRRCHIHGHDSGILGHGGHHRGNRPGTDRHQLWASALPSGHHLVLCLPDGHHRADHPGAWDPDSPQDR